MSTEFCRDVRDRSVLKIHDLVHQPRGGHSCQSPFITVTSRRQHENGSSAACAQVTVCLRSLNLCQRCCCDNVNAVQHLDFMTYKLLETTLCFVHLVCFDICISAGWPIILVFYVSYRIPSRRLTICLFRLFHRPSCRLMRHIRRSTRTSSKPNVSQKTESPNSTCIIIAAMNIHEHLTDCDLCTAALSL